MAGQSISHLSIFSPSEVELLAEDEMVQIVPNMRMNELNFICIASKVPLLLALALKKRGKSMIQWPDWMSTGNLTKDLEAERESPREFQPLPFHYVEISNFLFDHARDDIPYLYMARSLIEDNRDVRFHEVETDLETISGCPHTVKQDLPRR